MMLKRPRILTAVLAAALPLFLSHCSADEGGLTSEDQSPALHAPTTETGVVEAPASVSLDAEGAISGAQTRRDPFRTPWSTPMAPPVRLTGDGPLEAWELSSFVLTGVVVDPSRPKALVQAPNGKGYVIETGTVIGRKGGRVESIDSTGVKIIEESRNGITGDLETRTAVLSLPIDEESPSR